MSRNSLALDRAAQMFDGILLEPARIPVSFEYGGRRYSSFGGAEFVKGSVSATRAGRKATLRFRLDETLEARVEAAYCAEFGEMEYTVWFENNGGAPSKRLRDVFAIDFGFDGADPLLRGCLGDHDNFYAAYEQDLLKADKRFRSDSLSFDC